MVMFRPESFRADSFRVALIGLVGTMLIGSVLVGCAGGGSSTSTEGLRGYRPEPVRLVGSLEAPDHSTVEAGDPFRLVAPPDSLLLVYFGYLTCPDICPTTMVDNAAGLSLLAPDLASRVEVAFVTVDPERDSGTDVARYLGSFFPDFAHHALRPVGDHELHGLSYRFGATWQISPHAPGEPYEVAHSGSTYVVDDTGEVVWEWPFGTTGAEVEQILRVLFAQMAGR